MSTIAIAACTFELPTDNLAWVQVLPAGLFKLSDGRKMNVPHWHIDAASAKTLIAKFNARKNPLVIDYEHQTLYKEKNGKPAIAAGFIRELQWREDSGLWAKAEYNPRAKKYIEEGEYRYFSPVFEHDAHGTVKTLLMGALTNDPAIDGMAALIAHACALITPCEVKSMSEETKNTQQTPSQKADYSAIASALNLDKNADEKAIIAACNTLTLQANSIHKPITPDPAQYVPIAAMRELQNQVAALSAKMIHGELETVIATAKQHGKLLPAQEAWARDYGEKDLNGLKTYLESASPIAALTQMQGKAPVTNELGLSDEEITIAKLTGLTAKEFAAAKAARKSQ